MFCTHFRSALSALTMPKHQTKAQCEKLLLEESCPTRSGVVTWLDLKHLLDKGRGGKKINAQTETTCAAQLSRRPF